MAANAISGDEFERRMADLIGNGYLAVTMSIGKKFGLFDVLLASNCPLSSAELAAKTKLKERYVREWLRCLAMSGVVDIDGKVDVYSIAENKKAVLLPIIPRLGIFGAILSRFTEVQECFHLDGPSGLGLDNEDGGFLSLIGKIEEQSADSVIDADLLASVPELKQKLEAGIDVCEFGSNAGGTVMHLAQRFPNSHFRGSDICEQSVSEASRKAAELGISNVSFETVDLCHLPASWYSSFDYVFVRDVIHDLPNPPAGVDGLRKSLRPGGLCSVIDINASSNPRANLGKPGMDRFYTISTFFCIPFSLHLNPDSEAYGAMWGVEKGKELFADSGFHLLHCGPSNCTSDLYHFVLQK